LENNYLQDSPPIKGGHYHKDNKRLQTIARNSLPNHFLKNYGPNFSNANETQNQSSSVVGTEAFA
jgi:hypothetical protein